MAEFDSEIAVIEADSLKDLVKKVNKELKSKEWSLHGDVIVTTNRSGKVGGRESGDTAYEYEYAQVLAKAFN